MTTNTRAGQVWQYNNEQTANGGLVYIATWLLLSKSETLGYVMNPFGAGEFWTIYYLEDKMILEDCILFPGDPNWKLTGDTK